jgi:hypothetical protein
MSAESADAHHVGVGVAATCLGAVCSLYTCCRHVWRRLKGYTPAVGAGAAVAAATLAAGQLASSSAGSAPPPRGGASEASAARCTGQDAEPSCRVDVVFYKVYFVIALIDTFKMLDIDREKKNIRIRIERKISKEDPLCF